MTCTVFQRQQPHTYQGLSCVLQRDGFKTEMQEYIFMMLPANGPLVDTVSLFT